MTVISSVFKGADPDELAERLGLVFPGIKVFVKPGAGQLHFNSLIAAVGNVSALQNTYNQEVCFGRGEAINDYIISMPYAGGVQGTFDGVHEAHAEQILCFDSLKIETTRMAAGTKLDALRLPFGLLNARLAQLLDRQPTERLRFTPVVDASEGGPAALRSVTRGMLHATDGASKFRSSRAIQSLTEGVIDLALEMLPNNYSEALQRPPVKIGPRQVRRAVAYIHDNPMPVLTIDELAAICKVSVRSLQYTFRDFVGMTPFEYWRNVRLERAIEHHRRHPTESLTRIAAVWGFTNVSRFRAMAGAAAGDGD